MNQQAETFDLVFKMVNLTIFLLLFSSVCYCCDFTDRQVTVDYSQTCETFCGISFVGNCSCYTRNETNSLPQVYLKCSNTNASKLMLDIESLSNCSASLYELHVQNSNLNHLYNLPSGMYNIQNLILDNTGIDLETIRESHELLKSLKILRISNENFTEVWHEHFM